MRAVPSGVLEVFPANVCMYMYFQYEFWLLLAVKAGRDVDATAH